MNKILKYSEHLSAEEQAKELINLILNPMINESNISKEDIQNILKGLARDLNFNYSLVFTFGSGIKAMFPIVDNLIKNGSLRVELSKENIVLLCIAAISIIYLEEKKNRTTSLEVECPDCDGLGYEDGCTICDSEGCEHCDDCPACGGSGKIKFEVSKKDVKNILHELQLRVSPSAKIGEGILKKIVECFKSIGNIVKVIFKNTPYVVSGLLEMFAYTSILLPTMNAVSSMIGKYDLNLETLPTNFLSLGIGVAGFLAKNSFNYLVSKLRDKLHLKVDPELNVPTAVRPYDIKDGDIGDMGKNKLIKEQ